MAFDKPTRNLLAKMVAACRRRLAEDVESQLQSTYGLYPDGTVLDVARTPDARHAADELRTLWQHLEQAEAGSAKEKRQRAYQRLVREIGFTLLNRLAALRLAEERGLVIECVRRGPESDGFQLFDQMANGALGNRYATYRAFLDGIYAELALDLGALFDRNDPRGLIFPGESALADVLAELNHPDLVERAIWRQDETIGWIYQYYNDPAERKQMRDASQAPRNSRELAVRNQFFTPRYVVEFLTDNTLGRIWYEMTVGRTQLAGGVGSGQKAEGSGQRAVGSGELSAEPPSANGQPPTAVCRYLVRRPVEIFLSTEYADLADADEKPIVEAVLHGDYGKLPPEAEWGLIGNLALLIDGYALAPKLGLGECGDFANARMGEYRATGSWRGNSIELWLCLFFEQRRWHHFGDVPTGTAWDDIHALYLAWRGALLAEQEATGATQEELLHQPVYIAPRTAKDPRALTMLDPACGSMHFGLYAFDLYETIYAEAWDRQEEVGRRQLAASSGQRAVGSGQRAEGGGQQAVSAAGDADDLRTVNRIQPTLQGDEHGSTQLPGLARMAEGDGTGGSGLSGDEELPARGNVRADESIAASGSVDSIQYRRGTGTSEQGGLHPLSVDRARVGSGSGDTGNDRTASEFPEQGTGATIGEPGGRDRTPHPRTYQLLGHAIDERTYARYLDALNADGWSYRRDDTAICPLPAAYPDKAAFLRDVPRLIIEHNIHGIDIDPRAVQIANLSLWLRAQRSWQAQGVPAAERPRIRRSNVVTAEPMPGDRALLDEFVATLQPPVLGDLVRVVFDKMQLAGEAGSLLKIETELSDAIAQAKTQWEASAQPQQTALLPEVAPAPRPRQGELFDVSAIDDATFWERAEGLVLAALARYAQQHDLRHRLFAGDAARGFAFIDVCRKRYDVVLMNPPFGGITGKSKDYLWETFPSSKTDVFAMFVERWLERLNRERFLGAITNKTGFFLQSFDAWRRNVLSESNQLSTVVDLGFGVLDSAMVETVAYAIKRTSIPKSVSFIRVINEGDKAHATLNTIVSQSDAIKSGNLYIRRLATLDPIPYRPICYWADESFVRMFRLSKPFAPTYGHIYQGIATGDNFRFLRCRWEVPLLELDERIWVTYAKGGTSEPWYSDSYLVVFWERDGQEIKANAQQYYGSASRTVKNESVFFKPGLTYTQVTVRGFFVRSLPDGSVFDMKGPMISIANGDLYLALGVFCSLPVRVLAKLITDSRQWHPTNIMSIPYAEPDDVQIVKIRDSVREIVTKRQIRYSRDETTSTFCHFVTSDGDDEQTETILSRNIDEIIAGVYGADLHVFEALDELFVADDSSITSDEDPANTDANPTASLISYVVGSAFARWDIRFATGVRPAPPIRSPFAPLPACPPGMLQNSEGLPATPADVPADYPLRIAWDGILVDDPGLGEDDEPHDADIVRRVREVLGVVYGDEGSGQKAEGRAEAGETLPTANRPLPTPDSIEAEACEILGVRDLREYFRKPGGFFADHLKRYSKSRRQAPIYWPLSTASGRYTVWIYYHRLDGETLYTVVNRYVDPKIDAVERALAAAEAGMSQAAGRDAVRLREQADDLRAFRAELDAFRTELLRVAGLPYRPNLNDGVILNAAPLHRLFGLRKWAKDTEATWRKLEAGDYDWAHIAYTIWPERVKDVCRRDRSIAIAHGLEALCEVEEKPKGRRKQRAAKAPDLDYPDEGEQDDE